MVTISGFMKHESYTLTTIEQLRQAGLRPTRQRIALAELLFVQGHRHVTAESLHEEARAAGVAVSLATVYNTLHQFTDAGILRQVAVDSARCYFDTNVSDHSHFFFEESGELADIEGRHVEVEALPQAPSGHEISGVDVIFRLRNSAKS